MKLDFPRGPVLVGAASMFGLAFGASVLVTSSLVGDPGSMDRGFGQLYGSLFVLGFGAALVLALRYLWRSDSPGRGRGLAAIALSAVTAVLVFGSMSYSGLRDHDRRERALRATASWRFDFEDDLADAYWAWYVDNGGTEGIYTGDKHEWWSLDPDGDGVRDDDAPILRVLRDDGWSERGVSVFANHDDYGIDQIQWNAEPAEAWCIAVSRDRSLIFPDWSHAEPQQCDGLQVPISGS